MLASLLARDNYLPHLFRLRAVPAFITLFARIHRYYSEPGSSSAWATSRASPGSSPPSSSYR